MVKADLRKFVNMLVGNRVFDVYLKYMGIKTLTTATLVPGGKNLPVLDDPLVGNYLKLAGLSTLNVTLSTLVPLGTLMLVYELYEKKESQKGGNLNKYVKRIYGHRVFDLFFKYQGLKTLTSATLVPFALLLGRDALEDVFNDNQKGGSVIPEDMPVLDDPLLGNYLKLAGLSVLELTADTLVPLGIVAVLYNTYLKK